MDKAQVVLYLAIGNLTGAVIWNPPVHAWDLASWVTDTVNGIHDSLAPGRSEAQTPLPVPQDQPPIGNSGNQATLQPCAAPPPTMALRPQKPRAQKLIAQKPVMPVVEESPQTVPIEVTTDRLEYNQGGSITQAQADRMSRFKKNQSYKAIRALLGTPNYREPDADIYIIQGTGDGITVPHKLIVSYALDAEDNFTTPRAMNWYQQ